MIPRYLISLYAVAGAVTAFGFLRDLALGLDVGSKSSCSDVLFVVVLLFCLDGELVSIGGGLSVGGSGALRRTTLGSGVIADRVVVVLCGVAGDTVAVGANDNFVCRWFAESVPSALITFVCFVFMPPRGEASFPFVLVGLRLFFALRVMVALVASVRQRT